MEDNKKIVELSIPEGWEFDEVKDGKIIIKEKVNESRLSTTWIESAKILDNLEYIDTNSRIETYKARTMLSEDMDSIDLNSLPRNMGKPMLALCQLLVCRNAWWKVLNWKPNWTNGNEPKYCISNYNGVIQSPTNFTVNRILCFPTKETRDRFYKTFKDLIEEAIELL